MAAAPTSHLASAQGKKLIQATRRIDTDLLESDLSPGQEIRHVAVDCKLPGASASKTYGLLISLANGYAIVDNRLSGEDRQGFIDANAGTFFRKHGVTLGPASDKFPTGFQIGNLKERPKEDNDRAILRAFAEAGMPISAEKIKYKRPTADETWMFVYNMSVAERLTSRHIFSIETRVKGGTNLTDFGGAKEALLLMERLIEKKMKGAKIFVHITDGLGQTNVSYDKALHDSYYKKVHKLEAAKELGRDTGIHGSSSLNRLNLGVADVVLRTAKALTKYFGPGYDPAQDRRHIEECTQAIGYMKEFCRSIEVMREKNMTVKELFRGPPGGASAPKKFKPQGSGKPSRPRRRRKKPLNEAFSHLIL
jgi:hypothetical protein